MHEVLPGTQVKGFRVHANVMQMHIHPNPYLGNRKTPTTSCMMAIGTCSSWGRGGGRGVYTLHIRPGTQQTRQKIVLYLSGVITFDSDSLREVALSGLGGRAASLAAFLRCGCCLERPSHIYTSPSSVTAAVRYLPTSITCSHRIKQTYDKMCFSAASLDFAAAQCHTRRTQSQETQAQKHFVHEESGSCL